jgi:hypothetical protein
VSLVTQRDPLDFPQGASLTASVRRNRFIAPDCPTAYPEQRPSHRGNPFSKRRNRAIAPTAECLGRAQRDRLAVGARGDRIVGDAAAGVVGLVVDRGRAVRIMRDRPRHDVTDRVEREARVCGRAGGVVGLGVGRRANASIGARVEDSLRESGELVEGFDPIARRETRFGLRALHCRARRHRRVDDTPEALYAGPAKAVDYLGQRQHVTPSARNPVDPIPESACC